MDTKEYSNSIINSIKSTMQLAIGNGCDGELNHNIPI